MDSSNLAKINKTNADKQLSTTRHDDILQASVNTSNTVLSATASLISYLEGSVSKVQVINQLESIAMPDVLEVVDAVNNLHATMKNFKGAELGEVTRIMTDILSEAKKIPKETATKDEIDYTEQLTALGEAIRAVESVVKAQKLIVEPPTVNVEPPDYKPLQKDIKDVVTAVKKIVIPEYKTDNAKVEALITKSNKLLKELIDKPVSSGGGGGGRVSPYQDSNGIPKFITVGFDPGVDITTDISTPGIVIETDGARTLTTDYTTSIISEVWS